LNSITTSFKTGYFEDSRFWTYIKNNKFEMFYPFYEYIIRIDMLEIEQQQVRDKNYSYWHFLMYVINDLNKSKASYLSGAKMSMLVRLKLFAN
jgi:hypothetical protein